MLSDCKGQFHNLLIIFSIVLFYEKEFYQVLKISSVKQLSEYYEDECNWPKDINIYKHDRNAVNVYICSISCVLNSKFSINMIIISKGTHTSTIQAQSRTDHVGTNVSINIKIQLTTTWNIWLDIKSALSINNHFLHYFFSKTIVINVLFIFKSKSKKKNLTL